jgi:hypothetical protein
LLQGARLWYGDSNATLAGTRRDFVIVIEARDVAALGGVRRLMAGFEERGLKPLAERFLAEDEVAKEPLVLAARINELDVRDRSDSSFVHSAWDQV